MQIRSLATVIALTTPLACSGGGGASGSEGGAAPVEGPSIDGSTGGSASASGASVSASGTSSCAIELDEQGCTGSLYEDESIPLDIYVMFDRSGSMCNCIDPPASTTVCDPECRTTRLEAIREAMTAFMADPASAGIGIGLGYFGQQPLGAASCDDADYAEPAVDFVQLPAGASEISTSLEGAEPVGETPTGPALRGACASARDWKRAHPGHEVVLLLVTDGEPKAPVTCGDGSGPCCPSLPDAVDAASSCLEGTPGLRTYVLGVGPFLENLAQIAAAGGTREAHLVEGGDVSARVLDALNAIRGDAAIPCELSLPPAPAGTTLSLDRVNVVYASSTCEGGAIPRVEARAACGDGPGWSYDDPVSPTRVELCPATCEQVSIPGGQLMLSVGCQTVETIR